MKIAMWSGPRNLSTAMMYSFAARTDCAVWDEPFYAAYLKDTGLNHPMRAEILAEWPNQAQDVIDRCTGPIPDGKTIYYQKHMTHHMLPQYDQTWAADCVNVFLIRHPARVIASYGAKKGDITLDDIGFAQQVELFDRLGGAVIDSADIRQNPLNVLERVCAYAGISFDPAMLSWPRGPKPFDGPWAAHWYDAVHKSTGFAGAEGDIPVLDGYAAELLQAALPLYAHLRSHADRFI